MINETLPTVIVTEPDLSRLERLVMGSPHDEIRRFLLQELNRAEWVPVGSAKLHDVVTMGSWVTYRTDERFTPETCQLVFPEQPTTGGDRLSVLTPIGAALLGLKVGSCMPFVATGGTRFVRVDGVSRTDPKVLPRSCASSSLDHESLGDEWGHA